MKKKLTALLLAAAILFLPILSIKTFADFEPDTITMINGKIIKLDKPVFFDDNYEYIYIPVRSFFEENGYKITFDATEKTIYGTNGTTNFSITIGSDTFKVNNEIFTDEYSPSKILNGTAYISDFSVSRIINSYLNYYITDDIVDFVRKDMPQNYNFKTTHSSEKPVLDKSEYNIVEREFSNIYMQIEDALKDSKQENAEYTELSKEISEYSKLISLNSQRLNTQEKIDTAKEQLQKYIEKLKAFAEKNKIKIQTSENK